MKNINAFTLAKIELDKHLFNELKALGLVQTKAELGRLCGKNASYVSCMRNKGFGVQIGSLAFLAARFTRMAADETDGERCVKIKLALQTINHVIDEKCRLREIELHA